MCGILGILVTAGGLKLSHKDQDIIFYIWTWECVLFPQIEFIKEIRPESGGVKSEFFHCIFEEMTKTEYGMFIYPEKGSCMWFPANVSLYFLMVFQNRKSILYTAT